MERLRDPNAVQTRGRLGRTDGSRCCLGVLCDIAVEQFVIGTPYSAGDDLFEDHHHQPSLTYGDSEVSLPDRVQAWAGTAYETEPGEPDYGEDPQVEITQEWYDKWRIFSIAPNILIGQRYLLSALNDAGITFPAIADLIEEQL